MSNTDKRTELVGVIYCTEYSVDVSFFLVICNKKDYDNDPDIAKKAAESYMSNIRNDPCFAFDRDDPIAKYLHIGAFDDLLTTVIDISTKNTIDKKMDKTQKKG